MEDMERYGDYNDIDEEEKGKPQSPIQIILKILVAVIIIAVIGLLAFRIIIFNSYPESMSTLYLTDSLKALGDSLTPMTQSNSVKYDDSRDGNFFFDYLTVVPEADHLQVSIRYNTSLITAINETYGLDLSLDAAPDELFDFKLTRTKTGYVAEEGDTDVPTEPAGELVYVACDSSFMYKYARLAFDGCDLGLDEGETAVGWVRLEISVKALADNPDAAPYYLAVYVGEFGLVDSNIKTAEIVD